MSERRYVVRLEYKNWVDNLYLAGPDTAAQQNRLGECIQSLDSLQKQSADHLQYRRKAVDLFETYGFYEIRK